MVFLILKLQFDEKVSAHSVIICWVLSEFSSLCTRGHCRSSQKHSEMNKNFFGREGFHENYDRLQMVFVCTLV